MLPGLAAISGINCRIGLYEGLNGSVRVCLYFLLALTIPAVTVDARLNGFPTATTHSPFQWYHCRQIV
jgi:hypothetical protein